MCKLFGFPPTNLWSTFIFKEIVIKKKSNNFFWLSGLIGGGKPKTLHTQELSTLPLQINENFTRKAYLGLIH